MAGWQDFKAPNKCDVYRRAPHVIPAKLDTWAAGVRFSTKGERYAREARLLPRAEESAITCERAVRYQPLAAGSVRTWHS